MKNLKSIAAATMLTGVLAINSFAGIIVNGIIANAIGIIVNGIIVNGIIITEKAPTCDANSRTGVMLSD
jgi:uncharacterized membrane protein